MNFSQAIRGALLAAAIGLLAGGQQAGAAPRQMVDTDLAVSVWKMKPKAKNGETTAAMRVRATKLVSRLLDSDLRKLDYDSSFWNLLEYLEKLPWDAMTPGWRNWFLDHMPNKRLRPEHVAALVARLDKKPLYEFTPKELDVYLAHVQRTIPELRARVLHFARKNLNQPYDIYLLGEFPWEVHDDAPTFNLGKGDCVVFSEHMYAMALSGGWEEFYDALQRIRYKGGKIGMTTRNHFTEADWDINNRWLVKDVTTELGATSITQYTEKIDRAAFFNKFGLNDKTTTELLKDSYIPAVAVPSALARLRDGDFVNVVRGVNDGVWVGHVGLIGHGPDGTIHFIHSTRPKSKEQPIMEYLTDNVKKNGKRAKKGDAQFLGFKFLRLREDAPAELEKLRAAGPVTGSK